MLLMIYVDQWDIDTTAVCFNTFGKIKQMHIAKKTEGKYKKMTKNGIGKKHTWMQIYTWNNNGHIAKYILEETIWMHWKRFWVAGDSTNK